MWVATKNYFNTVILKLLHHFSDGEFGGADNLKFYLSILKDMGYKKVLVLVDNNKKKVIEELRNKYKEYKMIAIPTDDIRTKEDKNIIGIISNIKSFKINEDYVSYVKDELIPSIKTYFEEIKEEENTETNIIQEQENINFNINREVNDLIKMYFYDKKDDFFKYAKIKYPDFIFRIGGGEDEIHEISNKKYRVIQKCTDGIDEKRGVSYKREIIVNLDDSSIKIKKIKETKNTLPINIIRKMINRIF